MNGKTTHLLLVLQEKMYDTEFCIPIQGVYEPMVPAASASRYQLVVDGEYYSGHRFTHVTNPPALADPPAAEPEPAPAVDFEPSAAAHYPTSIADYGGRELAKELAIPVLTTAQLSRESERRPDKRPQLSDLRDSGALEQDANTV